MAELNSALAPSRGGRFRGKTGITAADAEIHFLEFKKVRPLMADLTFGDWISFLVTQHLALMENDRYKITEGGQEFLAWILRSRLKNDRQA